VLKKELWAMIKLWSFNKTKRKQLSYDEIATGYNQLQQYGSSNEYYINTVKKLGNISGKVLDVGCGYGALLLELKKENKNVGLYGIDICENAVTHCRKLGIKAEIGNADSISYADKVFDTVIMGEVIEHVVEQEKALKEVYRILKDNGRFLLTTDNLWWLIIMQLKNIIFPWKPKYERRRQPTDDEFTYYRLKKLLAGCNFEIIQRERSGPIAIAEKYLKRFKWSIILHKRHWVICRKILSSSYSK